MFALIKAKFDGSVLSRNPVAQINEVLAKCVARRAQPVQRRQGDLHDEPRADVLVRCTRRGAVVNDLSDREQRAVRTALRFLRRRLGAARQGAALRVALRVARFADVSMDELLAGQWLSPQVCLHCGHPSEDFTDEETVVE